MSRRAAWTGALLLLFGLSTSLVWADPSGSELAPDPKTPPPGKSSEGKTSPKAGPKGKPQTTKPGAKKPSKKKAKKKAKKKPYKRAVKPGPPKAFINVTLPGRSGTYMLVTMEGKIRALARRLRLPPNLPKVDMKGALVLPGRIDVWASIGGPNPLGKALDAFDPYALEPVREGLRGGVTTAFLNPARSSGPSGEGAVIKLIPGAPLDQVLVREGVALHSSLGFSGARVAGLRDYDALQKQLLAARNYQDAWLDYEEKLEKYTKALKKLAGAKGAKGKTGKPAGPRRPTPRRPARPAPSKPKAPSKPGAAPKAPSKPKGPTKPRAPRVNRALASFARVLEGELPLRIEAHRVEDIANALDLQKEFGFRLILEGATEAHELAEVLAKRKVAVVLGSQDVPGAVVGSDGYRRSPSLAANLADAGVELFIGSDGWARVGELSSIAARHVNGGLDPAVAEAALTQRAAELLGLGDRLGRLKSGYQADLVFYSKSELGGESIELVLVDGRVVHRRSAE